MFSINAVCFRCYQMEGFKQRHITCVCGLQMTDLCRRAALPAAKMTKPKTTTKTGVRRFFYPAAVMTAPLLHLWALWKQYSHVTFSRDLSGAPSAPQSHTQSPSVSHAQTHTYIPLLPSSSSLFPSPSSSSSLSAADSLWTLITHLSFLICVFYFCSSPLLNPQRRRGT